MKNVGAVSRLAGQNSYLLLAGSYCPVLGRHTTAPRPFCIVSHALVLRTPALGHVPAALVLWDALPARAPQLLASAVRSHGSLVLLLVGSGF